MVEGQGTKDFTLILKLIYTESAAAHLLLQKLTLSVVDYLGEQIKAGVNAVMLFDTWGGILTPENYQSFSLAYMQQIIQQLKANYPDIPVILFTKGGGQWLEYMTATGCDALGVDWTCDLGQARRRVGDKVALQGNLDPSVLLSSEKCIREQVQKVLASYGHGSGHVFNLGHGITPNIDPGKIKLLTDHIRSS